MAIKRPITKKPTHASDENTQVFKKSIKKASVEVPDNDAEPEPKPEEAPTRKGSAIPKKSAKAKKSFADIFDKTKPNSGGFAIGEFKMYVDRYELKGEIAEEGEDQDDLSVCVFYEGHADEEENVAGKQLRQQYTLFKDGEPGEVGIGIMKRDLDILGYEDVALADLEELFTQIAEERPVVVVKTKQNGTFVNAYLQGLAEG